MNIDEKLDYYIARCDALDAAGIGELLKEIKAQRQAAQGGVTDQTLREMCRAYETTAHGFADFTPNERGLQAMRAALEAALSAGPAAQGEASQVVAWMTKAGRVINTETRERVLADAELGGEYVAAAKAAEAYCIPLFTAPPAQPAEVEATLRRILERGKHRTDGDLATLLDRVEHMTRGDQDLITMQRTEIRLLDERPAQPAERVPEGWRDEAERLYDAVKVFPENRGNPVLVGWDGFEGLLLLRNHVGKLLASPAPSPARGDGGEG